MDISDESFKMRGDDLVIATHLTNTRRRMDTTRNDGFISSNTHRRPEVAYTPDSSTDSFAGNTPLPESPVDGEEYEDELVFAKSYTSTETISRKISRVETMEEQGALPPYQAHDELQNHRNSTDPIIAVIGATGAGKSSFIDVLGGIDDMGHRLEINDGLAPCTKKITWYNASVNDNRIQLLDTPGFDDTTLTDSEILEALSLQLVQAYKDKRSLNGIIYLHDISNNRMGGQSTKNLLMFQNLVGDKSLKNIVLVTTNWSQSNQIQLKREAQLKTIYWKTMNLYGSQTERHDGSRESAAQIVQSLIAKPPTVIKIVDELARQGLRWEDTATGNSINQALESLRAKMQNDLDKLTAHIEHLEGACIAEAEQGARRQAELEDRYARETQENNRQYVEAMTDLERQLKVEQDEQNAKKHAAEEERQALKEKLDRLMAQQARMKHGIATDVSSEEQSNNATASSQVRLYFRYPGYCLLDLTAWLSRAIMTALDMYYCAMLFIEVPEERYTKWPILMVMWVGGHLLFNKTFFNSRHPEDYGIFLLFVDIVFRASIWFGSNERNPGEETLFIITHCCVFCVGLRYMWSTLWRITQRKPTIMLLIEI